MIADKSIKEFGVAIRMKKISSEDAIRESYETIEKYDKSVNAVITLVDKQDAIAQARKIDNEQARLPLAGIPFVMKDAYVTAGVRTTAASKVLDTFIPKYSATVYKKLEEAGAILIGKMNMDAWGHGASTENTDYGVCHNPWNINLSSGGSGGGPAAAIAARYCLFGIGEDTGGSIRNPAAWNNISAMKVSYGRVSRYGAIAYASSLDTMGPTAKSVEDCAYVLQTIAGLDQYDATSSSLDVPDYMSALKQHVKGRRIAFPKEFYGVTLEKEIKNAIYEARKVFQTLGILVEDVSLPMLEYGQPVYYIIAPSETSSNLGRYDGIRFGNGRDYFTNETKRRIMSGTYTLSAGYYDAFYKKAMKVRSLFIREYTNLLSRYDAILSPVTPTMPMKFGELLEDPIKNMMADLYNGIVNIVGVPSLAIPCGFNAGDLPIGMQLVGKMFSEDTLFSLGHAYQQKTDWHTRKPSILL